MYAASVFLSQQLSLAGMIEVVVLLLVLVILLVLESSRLLPYYFASWATWSSTGEDGIVDGRGGGGE